MVDWFVEKEREREKMQKVTSVNQFIRSLPRVKFPKRRIWNVMIDGVGVQGVSASDNREETARAYIAAKYPGKEFTLVFAGWKEGRNA